MPWAAKPGEILKGAPSLWAFYLEPVGAHFIHGGIAVHGFQPDELKRLGWVEVVDAEGRSR